MAQYAEIKAANPDCLLFYRMGDFYELFFEDAEIASRALGIVLTKRGRHNGADIPMCGVPVHRADEYLQRLIAQGHRVAVCEQLEDPAEARKRGSKSVVRRDVTRLVTPGTITEEALLDPSRANTLVAIARVRASDGPWSYGVAALDISTGAFELAETSADGLAAELARFDPREIIVSEAVHEDPALAALWAEVRAPIAPQPKEGIDAATAAARLAAYFEVASVDAFGEFSRGELAAAGAAITYVERTQRGARPPLSIPQRASETGVMRIDAATRANLELSRTLSGERERQPSRRHRSLRHGRGLAPPRRAARKPARRAGGGRHKARRRRLFHREAGASSRDSRETAAHPGHLAGPDAHRARSRRASRPRGDRASSRGSADRGARTRQIRHRGERRAR